MLTAIYLHTKIIISIYMAIPHSKIWTQHIEKDNGFPVFFLLIRQKK